MTNMATRLDSSGNPFEYILSQKRAQLIKTFSKYKSRHPKNVFYVNLFQILEEHKKYGNTVGQMWQPCLLENLSKVLN